MDEWINNWMVECMKKWMNGSVCVLLNEWMAECINGWMDECMKRWMNGLMD